MFTACFHFMIFNNCKEVLYCTTKVITSVRFVKIFSLVLEELTEKHCDEKKSVVSFTSWVRGLATLPELYNMQATIDRLFTAKAYDVRLFLQEYALDNSLWTLEVLHSKPVLPNDNPYYHSTVDLIYVSQHGEAYFKLCMHPFHATLSTVPLIPFSKTWKYGKLAVWILLDSFQNAPTYILLRNACSNEGFVRSLMQFTLVVFQRGGMHVRILYPGINCLRFLHRTFEEFPAHRWFNLTISKTFFFS